MLEIGVRELKRDLSAYLERAANGEQIRITKRGKPLADLTAATERPQSKMEQMIAAGRVTPAKRPWGSVPLPPAAPFNTDPLADLLADREDEETLDRIVREARERRGPS